MPGAMRWPWPATSSATIPGRSAAAPSPSAATGWSGRRSSGEYPWLEVLDDSAHFVFVIGANGQGVPVRFYRGAADEPTERTLRRQEMEVQQLSLALGEAAAEGLAFRLAVETGEAGRVERVVFLALRGEDRVECFWPVPLELLVEVAAGAAVQLRLMADEGHAGPGEAARRSAPLPAPLPRQKAASGPQAAPGHAAVAEPWYVLMSMHLTCLNPAQRAAATTPAPLLVLAGAGSGKTETLIRRVADLILAGEAPDRLLCITFTAKAAGEMRGRLAALLGPEQTPRWVGTFHAVMARLLIEDGAGVPGLPRGFAILGQGDARALLMQASGIRDAKEASLLQEAVSLLKNGLVTEPRRLPRSSALARFEPEVLAQAAAVLPAYQAALAQRQALDFDDLIATPVAAMQADPALAAHWSSRWAEILVDEYQDTNHAQHALVRLLAGKPGRVFAVGDDLQAIYGWRGADVGHIRRFQKDYRAAPAPLKLETNYRSTPTILRAANAIAAEDPEALPKNSAPGGPEGPPRAADHHPGGAHPGG